MQSYRSSNSSSESNAGKIGLAVIIGIVFLFVGIMFASASERINSGEACVVTRNGKAVGVAEAGREWMIPAIDGLACFSIREQNLEFTGVESDANFTDSVIVAKSKDGVEMNLAAMVYFQIPTDNLQEVYTFYGKDTNALVENHLQAITRNHTRAVVEQTIVDDIYLGGMETTSDQIEERLVDAFEGKGVTLVSFALTAVDPSDTYRSNVQQQVEQQQAAQLKTEEIKVAEQEAERQRTVAQGEADAAVIRSQGEAESLLISAEAQAEADRTRAEAITPEILQLEYYEALKTVNWAILDGDDVQPMLPIEEPQQTEE